MAKFRANRRSLQRIEAELKNRGRKFQRNAIYALAIWGDDTIGLFRAELVRVGAVDTYELYASISRRGPRIEGTRVKITLFSPKEYASVIEFGRQAKKGKPPPIKALAGWAKRNGLIRKLPVNLSLDGKYRKAYIAAKAIRRNAKKRRGGKRKQQQFDPIIRDFLVLLGIQEAIYKHGIKGRKPFSTVWNERRRTFHDDIVRMIKSL